MARPTVVLVRTNVAIGELLAARQALEEAQRVVAGVTSRPAFTGIRVGYAGDLVTGLAEYSAIAGDLVRVGAVGRRVPGAAGAAGLLRARARHRRAGRQRPASPAFVLTFGLTRLAIGHLDIATGFMVSIVAGSGINAGIIYNARYVDARRWRSAPADAVRLASTTTWLPTFGSCRRGRRRLCLAWRQRLPRAAALRVRGGGRHAALLAGHLPLVTPPLLVQRAAARMR